MAALHITTPAPHHSVFTGRMPFLPPNQQRQSTEVLTYFLKSKVRCHGIRPTIYQVQQTCHLHCNQHMDKTVYVLVSVKIIDEIL